jgi:hypothetical protein
MLRSYHEQTAHLCEFRRPDEPDPQFQSHRCVGRTLRGPRIAPLSEGEARCVAAHHEPEQRGVASLDRGRLAGLGRDVARPRRAIDLLVSLGYSPIDSRPDGTPTRRRPLPEPPSIAGVGPCLSPACRVAWADLLQRVFEIDALRCPTCRGRMRVLSAITDPIVASRILRYLSLPPRAPPRASAKDGEPVPGRAGEECLDEVPEFDFDQSPPSGD